VVKQISHPLNFCSASDAISDHFQGSQDVASSKMAFRTKALIEAQNKSAYICVHLRFVSLRSLRSFVAIPDLRVTDKSKLISTDPLYLLSGICYLLFGRPRKRGSAPRTSPYE
jgi:hypothetical protein